MKAESTPQPKQYQMFPVEAMGIMFARKAATVVITAKPRGVDNFAQDANQASAESSTFFLKELYLVEGVLNNRFLILAQEVLLRLLMP